jgi:hypothetical protein
MKMDGIMKGFLRILLKHFGDDDEFFSNVNAAGYSKSNT